MLAGARCATPQCKARPHLTCSSGFWHVKLARRASLLGFAGSATAGDDVSLAPQAICAPPWLGGGEHTIMDRLARVTPPPQPIFYVDIT